MSSGERAELRIGPHNEVLAVTPDGREYELPLALLEAAVDRERRDGRYIHVVFDMNVSLADYRRLDVPKCRACGGARKGSECTSG